MVFDFLSYLGFFLNRFGHVVMYVRYVNRITTRALVVMCLLTLPSHQEVADEGEHFLNQRLCEDVGQLELGIDLLHFNRVVGIIR